MVKFSQIIKENDAIFFSKINLFNVLKSRQFSPEFYVFFSIIIIQVY